MKPTARWPRRVALALAWTAFAGVVCTSIAAACARSWWAGELLANLRWQLGEFALALAVVTWLLRARKLAVASAVCAALHLGPALALWWPAEEREDDARGTTELCVAGANLLYSNTDAAALRRWLEEARPDVVACFEVSPFWQKALAELADLYPHQLIVPSPDVGADSELRQQLETESHEIISPHQLRWGMALLARHPLQARVVLGPPGCPDAYLEGELTVGGELAADGKLARGAERIQVLAVHPERPGKAWRIARRNALLEHVARATHWSPRALVIADLNATLYSPAFGDFVAQSGLRDTRQGFGRQPTWNPPYHLPGQWLDLDQIFVGAAFDVLERQCGADIGSDHLPILARLRVRGTDDTQ